MTLSTTDALFTYAGNGSTVDFLFPRKASSSADIVARLIDTNGVISSPSYTVGGSGSYWTVTYATAPASGYTVEVYRDPEQVQETDLTSEGTPLAAANNALDRLYMVAQRLTDRVSQLEAETGALGLASSLQVIPTGASSGRTLAAWTGDLINVKASWGGGEAVGDGVTDDHDAIQAAFDYAVLHSKSVVFPPGHYIINDSISVAPAYDYELGVWIMPGATLDFSGATLSGDGCLNFGSDTTYVEKTEPSVNVARYDRSITFAADQGFAIDDIGVIWNDADYSWGPSDDYFKSGDMFRVVGTGATLTADAPLSDNYNISGTIRVIRPYMGKLTINGGGEILCPQGVSQVGINVKDGRDVVIEDLRISGSRYAQVHLKRCWRPIVRNVDGWDIQASVTLNYGVALISCHEPLVEGCRLRTTRHAVVCSSGGSLASIPTRRPRVVNNTLKSSGASGCADMHGSTDCGVFENNDCDGPVTLGGRSPKLSGGRITSGDLSTGAGVCVNVRELKDANVTITDLVCEQTDAVSTGAVIVIDMSPAAIATTIEGGISIANVRIIDNQGDNDAVTIKLPSASTELISVSMNNVSYRRTGDANDESALVLFDANGGVFQRITLNGVINLARGVSTDFKCLLVEDCDGTARYSDTRALEYRCNPHTSRQIIRLHNFRTSNNARSGVYLGGQGLADATSSITVEVRDCYSASNDRTAGAVDYGYQVLNCDRVVFENNSRDASTRSEAATFTSSSGLLMTTTNDFPTFSAVTFTNSGGALPTGLSAGVTYYTVRVSATTARLATSYANAVAGTVISYTNAGTGTHTVTMYGTNRFDTIGSLLYRNNFQHGTPITYDVFASITGFATGSELVGQAVYDPASLVDGAGATTTVTVTGAALGDYVAGVSFSNDLQGITLTGWVSASNTVSVRFQNESTGTLDLASGTIRARVLKA